MKKHGIMFKIPLRTQNIFEEAIRLEKIGFYTTAILRYTNYLEHFLLIATLSYFEERNSLQTVSELNKISEIRRNRQLTFRKILNLAPNQLISPETRLLCNEIRIIRNEISAHSNFVIALDKTHRQHRQYADVGRYKKFIRSLYNLIKKHKINYQAKDFLSRGNPIIIFSNLEEAAYKAEISIVKDICEYVRKTIDVITSDIESRLYKNSVTSNLEKFMR